ncbi:MAG: ATP synthase F1 subunit gamma [Gemmatimonadetes bacterium]|nr:ATP synthase F1 subunit gamma [Gemmatimonadota bacterium]
MAKAREIRRRIRSIDKTRQITRTMEMVATSKLKRASDRVHAAAPYAQRLAEVINRLLDPEMRQRYALLRQPAATRRAAVLLLTSNRGLAGAFNVNLIREARGLLERLRGEEAEVALHVVGKKGINFFRFQRQPMASTRTDITDRPTAENAASLVDGLMAAFQRGELDAVYVAYAQFRSALSTPPAVLQILPVQPPDRGAEARGRGGRSAAEARGAARHGEAEAGAGARRWQANYILSPSAAEILNRLLPLYVRNSVYRALVETAAAEQGARRTAMKNATDNAGDMLERLQRTYNRARQAQITQEIAEIVGGAAALE